MKFEKYFNEHNTYIEPTLIVFSKPRKIKLCDLNKFLDSYRPFTCADVYLYEKFEYGDFDNICEAIVESKTIDPCYSKVYRKSSGIYKTGYTDWSIVSKFWNYHKGRDKFWEKPLQTGYDSETYSTRYIDKIEINVQGVYIISWEDKCNFDKLTRGDKNNE